MRMDVKALPHETDQHCQYIVQHGDLYTSFPLLQRNILAMVGHALSETKKKQIISEAGEHLRTRALQAYRVELA